MLVEFTVGNFLSFKEKKTLSLEATPITEYAESNVVKMERHDLLKGAVIYGANAGGKSNLIKAMSTMRRIVLHSFASSSTQKLGIAPFLLNTETEISPSFFEVLFIIKNIRYRYGFEVDNANIKSEWLFEAQRKTEKPLFIRENDAIEVMKNFPEGENLEEKTRDNALFLSVVDQFNGKTAKRIIQWFNDFVTISGLSHEEYKEMTFSMLENKKIKPSMLRFYTELDLGFEDIQLEKEPFNPKEFDDEFDIKTTHRKYDKKNNPVGNVEFEMRSQESSGTNKIFNISGPIFDVLNDGGVLVIDELDASLHPLLTLAVTKLFNSTEHNPKNAQFIFATHDTNLLHYGNYRRDQIYFVEKDPYGASDLYSLVVYKESDGKAIRKDRSFEKDYIQGRYGAIPFIGNLSNISK
ncbi:MAG: ATP-binding protein [Prevotellaceae bacterium]|jgi:AAA15 family ATPase/GTPase|nr:ATP-binding protein [Prevotellaceae bacterium]